MLKAVQEPPVTSLTSSPYPLLFTRKTACRALSMSLRKFDMLLANKAIKVKRINGGVYIHRDILLAFAASDQPVSFS